MKKRSWDIALEDNLLPSFKKDNERNRYLDTTTKKVIKIGKVLDPLMSSLIIWLKKRSNIRFLIKRISSYVWS